MDNQDGFFDKLSQYINNLKKFLDDKFWDSSFLLKRRRKEIKHTLEQVEGAKKDVQEQIKNIGREDFVAKQAVLKEIPDGTMAVYIMLNIMNGRDITAWEHALSALPSCSFGRPIYMEEEQVRHAITAQGDSLNSGYVALYVNHDDIIKEEGECDTLGQEIIGLKPEAINSEHIIKFVHYNQEVFLFLNKKLIADTSSSTDSPEAPAEAVDSEGGIGADVRPDTDKEGVEPSLNDDDSDADKGAQAVAEGDSQDSSDMPAEAVDSEGGIGADVQAPDADKEGVESGLNDSDSGADKGAQTVVEGGSQDSSEMPAESVDSESGIGADVQPDADKEGVESGLNDGDSGEDKGAQTVVEGGSQDSSETSAESVDSESGIGADVQPDADKEGVESGLNDGESGEDKGAQTVVEGGSQDSSETSAESVDSESGIGADVQPDADKEGVESGLNDGDSGVDKGAQAVEEGDSQDSPEAPAETVDSASDIGADVQPDTDKDGGDAVLKSDDIDAAEEEGGPRRGKKSGKAKKEETEPSTGQKSKKAKEDGAVKRASTSKKTASGEKAQSKTEK